MPSQTTPTGDVLQLAGLGSSPELNWKISHNGQNTNTDVEKNEGNIIQTTAINNESTTEYTVKKGDSLWLIARRFDIHVVELLEWNNLRKNKPLQPGQTLLIRKNITGAWNKLISKYL